MKAYIMTVTLAAMCAALVNLLAPEGKNGGIVKHVRLLTALALICVIAAPCAGFIRYISQLNIPSVETVALSGDNDKLLSETLCALEADEIEARLGGLVCEKFDISPDCLSVKVEVTEADGKPVITRTVLRLSGFAVFKNPYEIEKYVTGLLGCECDCIV